MPLSNSPTFLALRENFIHESLQAQKEIAEEVEQELNNFMSMPVTLPCASRLRCALGPVNPDFNLVQIEADSTFCDSVVKPVVFVSDNEDLPITLAKEMVSLSAIGESWCDQSESKNPFSVLEFPDSDSEDESDDYQPFESFLQVNSVSEFLSDNESVSPIQNNKGLSIKYELMAAKRRSISPILQQITGGANILTPRNIHTPSKNTYQPTFFKEHVAEDPSLDKENIANCRYSTPIKDADNIRSMPDAPPAPKRKRRR